MFGRFFRELPCGARQWGVKCILTLEQAAEIGGRLIIKSAKLKSRHARAWLR